MNHSFGHLRNDLVDIHGDSDVTIPLELVSGVDNDTDVAKSGISV